MGITDILVKVIICEWFVFPRSGIYFHLQKDNGIVNQPQIDFQSAGNLCAGWGMEFQFLISLTAIQSQYSLLTHIGGSMANRDTICNATIDITPSNSSQNKKKSFIWNANHQKRAPDMYVILV